MASRRARGLAWLGVLSTVAVVSAGLALVLRDDEPEAPAPAPAVIDVPPSGMVVHLERSALEVMPATAGSPEELIVEAAGIAPLAALEVWAGDQLVASDDAVGGSSTARARLEWVPDGPGDTILVARAIDRDGRSGQSNAVRVSVMEPRPPSVWRTATAIDGDTLDSVAERLGFPAAYVLATNPQLPVTGAIEAGIAVAVPDTAPELGDGIPPIPPELADVAVALGGSGRGRHGGANPPARPAPRSHDSLLAVQPPTLAVEVDVDECTANLTAAATSASQVVVEALAPTSPVFTPLQALDGGGEVGAPLGPGQHAFVAAAFEGGLSAFSPPVIVNGPDECEGTWTGPVKLINGKLTGGKAADDAYLYLSTTPGRWTRVPGTSGTSVPRVGSSFDFSPHLPLLNGKRLEVDAWGWSAGELVHIGRSVFVPPEGLSLSDIVGLTGTVRLDWIESPPKPGVPAVLTDDGDIEHPGKLFFRWWTSVPGVTHGLWQVTTYPTTPDGPLDPAGVVAQGIADGDGGDFEIDFAPLVGKPMTLALGAVPLSYPVAVGGFGATGPTDQVATTPSTTNGGSAINTAIAIPDEVLAKLDLPKPNQLWVRILPFSKDTFRGAVSNDVHIDTRKQIDLSLLDEIIKQQEALKKQPYDIEFDFTQPGAANLSLATCWSFTGWDPTALDQGAFNAAKNASTAQAAAAKGSTAFSYWIYLKILAAYPSSPLCATCYSAVGISIGGAKCADSGSGGITGIPILDDILAAGGQLIGAIISVGSFIWDQVIVGTFNKVKGFVVDTLGDACALFASSSVGADATDECHTLAAIAVDVALISFGIPPNLPTTEQAVQLAKGEIADAMSQMADDLGIPCDEIGTAANAAGKPELSCEAAINKMLDDLGAQLQAAYHQEAKSLSGLTFPPGMNVVPHPAGQVQPSKFDITVTLKQGAPLPTAPCSVMPTLQSGWYTGPANPFFGQAVVDVKGLSGAMVLDQATYGVGTVQSILVKSQFFSGWPFTFTTWKLPTPTLQPDGTMVATASYYLFQPTPHDPVPATLRVPGPAKDPNDEDGLTYYNQPVEVPWHSFGLHSGASYVAVLSGSCFGFAKSTTPLILFDEGPGPATKGVTG